MRRGPVSSDISMQSVSLQSHPLVHFLFAFHYDLHCFPVPGTTIEYLLDIFIISAIDHALLINKNQV